MADSVTQRILEDYPFVAFLMNDREVGALLREAVDPNKGYSPNTFRAKLMATSWWRRNSETQRTWATQVATDPAEAQRQRKSQAAMIRQAASRYGIGLTTAQLRWITESTLAHGQAPDGPEVMTAFANLVNAKNARPGARRTGARQIQQAARRDYLYKMSNKNAAYWGDRVARGLMTPEDVMEQVKTQALKLYPQFATGLKQGRTMGEMTDEYRQIIAQELELDPERIDLSEGKWSKVLGVRDSKGTVRPMTHFETVQMVRQDPRWWQTGHGKETDAAWSKNILAMFGKRAPMGLSGK